MPKVYKSLTDLIGKTPLLEFANYEKKHELKATVIGKLEYFNPAGSVKDRIAKAMIDDAEAKGLWKSGLSGCRRRHRRHDHRSGRIPKIEKSEHQGRSGGTRFVPGAVRRKIRSA